MRDNIITCACALAAVLAVALLADQQPAEADTHAAQEARQELRRDLAAARACPPGHAVLWTNGSSMECLREVQP